MRMKHKIKAFGEVMMRLDVPGNRKLEQTRTLDIFFSGTGVNVLSALSKYGHETAMVTTLPANSIGDAAVSFIRSLGISTTDINRDGEYIGMYFMENGFGFRPSVVTYTNRESSSFCMSTLSDYDLDNLLEDTGMIHFCGIGLAISKNVRELMIAVAERAKEMGITIVFDCNFRPKLWKGQLDRAKHCYEQMLELADVCFMTERDAKALLGMKTDKINRKEQIVELIPQIAKRYHIKIIAGTIRKNTKNNENQIEGFLFQDSIFSFSRAYTFQILDRVGGGDGFASGIMHGLVQDLSMNDIIEFSMAAGVLAQTIPGDSPLCTDSEVWALVNNYRTDLER